MQEEIWKDIKGYEGIYQISNLGNIKSLKRITLGKKYGNHKIKEKILKPNTFGKYSYITLCKNGKCKSFSIHRLVAQAFILNPNNYSDVNHKDGKTHNNNVNNLEWCTRSYNIKHAYNVLNRKKNIENFAKYVEKNKKKVNQYDLNGKFIKTWNCILDAEKQFHIISTGKICECCQHKNGRKSAFGYKWEYLENTKKINKGGKRLCMI